MPLSASLRLAAYNRPLYVCHRNPRPARSRTAFIKRKRASGPPFAGFSAASIARCEAVRGIDLDVEEGEFVAFLGPNGAGKTTTLKLLSGVINPTAGEARVLGYVPWERDNAYRRRFALVMGQKNQLWWDLPAAESFRLHQQIYRIDPPTVSTTSRTSSSTCSTSAACSISRSASCRSASG